VLPPLSLYIHIPWCVRKCPYCDFNSHTASPVLPEEEYVDALLADLDQDLHAVYGRELSSIFFGGGTPSLFSAAALGRLLKGVEQRIPFAAISKSPWKPTPAPSSRKSSSPTASWGSIACRLVSRASSKTSSRPWAASTMATKPCVPPAWRARRALTTSTWT
jgi:hypothetical protein